MTKKNADGTEVAEKLLEKETAKNEQFCISFIRVESCSTLRPLYGYENSVIFHEEKYISYPPNKTDQLHGATIADLVSQGQGQVEETELANFDYPVKIVDGKLVETPDRGEKARGPRSLEWADPAERYEAEIAVHNEIVTGIRREAAEKAEAFARQRSIEAEQKAVKTAPSTDTKEAKSE